MTSFRYYSSEQANDSKGYWISELESLGISSEEINNYLNNSKNSSEEEGSSIRELADLVENIKQTLYQEYKTAYSERMIELEEEGEYIIT